MKATANGILKGIVVSNADETKAGVLTCSIPDVSDDLIHVTMTSPFYSLNNGGMLAIPEVGSKILIHYDENDNSYYYLSTIIEKPDNEQKGGLKEFSVIGDKYIYSERGRPQKITYANQFNAGLHIDRRLTPDQMVNKVDLKSETGKKLSLSDSPKMDACILRNEHGDGLIITSDANDIHSERSIELKCKGSQKFVVFQGEAGFYIVDGRDFNIENWSTGAFANENATGRFGNINFRSDNSDICMISKADDGRVFLVTPNARIQIESDGSVVIDSVKNVQIKATDDIDIKSDKAIRIQGQSIDIKAANSFRVQSGGDASILSTGTNSLDGDQVHFNSGISQPANETSITTPERNDYDE
jgi:hypothetical protein